MHDVALNNNLCHSHLDLLYGQAIFGYIIDIQLIEYYGLAIRIVVFKVIAFIVFVSYTWILVLCLLLSSRV